MAFTRVAALLHAALSDVAATQHHTATVAGDLNLADMAERVHGSLTSVGAADHRSAADQADMESEAGGSSVVRPNFVRFSPGVAKAWVRIQANGAITAGAYNIASITDTGVGDRTIVFDDDFSSNLYSPMLGIVDTTGGRSHRFDTFAVGSVQLLMTDGTTLTDIEAASVYFGDQ